MKKRLLALCLALCLVVGLLPVTALAAAPATLYLEPNSNWTQANARFAAYFFGNGEAWVSMTDSDGDGVYEVEVPTAKTYPSVIFCRMNPGNTTNNWDNKWNQTCDLTIPTDGKNLYTVPSGSWNSETTTWSTYTPVEHTYTVAGVQALCGTDWDVTNTANDMTKNSAGLYEKVSVTQSCPTLWDPMNCSTPGLPVHHRLPEFTQTHVH